MSDLAPRAATTVRHCAKDLLVYVMLAVLTLSIYGQVVHHEFVSYDDPLYVTDNPNVRDGVSASALAWAFTSGHAANWHPLTWLSHMLDCQLFGAGVEDAGSHHLTNVLLHGMGSMLLFLALKRMTGQLWPSAVVAVLFAVHPLRVESVAWVSERKDVLSGVFFMLTILAYGWYAEHRSTYRFWLVCLVFALGLLAKPMLVTVPLVLLLLDIWPLKRCHPARWPSAELFLEKLPLLALSATSCLVTLAVQRAGGAVHTFETISPAWRLINASVAYVTYIVKSIWPTHLAVFYPHPASNPDHNFINWLAAGSAAALLLAVVTLVVLRVVPRSSYLAVGWLWYLVMMVPVIGLLQVGMQSHADRYAYLPLIGVYLMVAWSLNHLVSTFPKARFVVSVIVGCALLALTVQARRQVSSWKNSETLFEHALSVTNNNYVAHASLGKIAQNQGRLEQAIVHHQEAVRLFPEFADPHNNWGCTLNALGHHKEALPHFEEALRIKPTFGDAHRNYGIALTTLGRHKEALDCYKAAVWLDPESALDHIYCGNTLLEMQRAAEAIGHFKLALRLRPDDAGAHNNWARALIMQGRLEEAVVHFRKALRLQPDNTLIRDNLRMTEAQLHAVGGGALKPPQSFHQTVRGAEVWYGSMARKYCEMWSLYYN